VTTGSAAGDANRLGSIPGISAGLDARAGAGSAKSDANRLFSPCIGAEKSTTGSTGTGAAAAAGVATNRLARSSRLSCRCAGPAASSLAIASRLWNERISTTGTGGSPGMPSDSDGGGAWRDSSSSASAAIGST
jgi:hypothetical protein